MSTSRYFKAGIKNFCNLYVLSGEFLDSSARNYGDPHWCHVSYFLSWDPDFVSRNPELGSRDPNLENRDPELQSFVGIPR